MPLVYSYLIGWIVGGIGLLIVLLLHTERRPLALLFALIGFGAAGFVSEGLDVRPWHTSLSSAAVGALVMGGFGYFLRLRVDIPAPPDTPPSDPNVSA